jgi:two-component system, NarL family, response regulator LiaR
VVNDTPVIRVILVDDQQTMHDIVAALLGTVDDIQLVGQVYHGADALKTCAMLQPDLVLMDVVMPGLSGPEVTAALLSRHPAVKVLAISSYHEYEHIRSMLDSGAIGYLVKGALAADLIDTIRATHRGNTVLSPEVVQTVLAPPTDTTPDFGLTDRELQVLRFMAQGMTNAQVATALVISAPTVRFHLGNILIKFSVDTRSEALVLAAKNHLLD